MHGFLLPLLPLPFLRPARLALSQPFTVDLPRLKRVLVSAKSFFLCEKVVFEGVLFVVFSHADLPRLTAIHVGCDAFRFFDWDATSLLGMISLGMGRI